MGDDLYAEVIPADRLDGPCRVYAPVGSHEDLLPYLVRRLLENGANSSFVNRITDEDVAIDDLVRDPVETVDAFDAIPHPRIPLPREIYRSQGHDRDNSMGINLYNDEQLRELAEQVNAAVRSDWRAGPLVPGVKPSTAATVEVTSPADRPQLVGPWQPAAPAAIAQAARKSLVWGKSVYVRV